MKPVTMVTLAEEIADRDAEIARLRSRIDRLVEIFERVVACSPDCDLAAVLAWVDPADHQRVIDLQTRRATDAERENVAEIARLEEVLDYALNAKTWDDAIASLESALALVRQARGAK